MDAFLTWFFDFMTDFLQAIWKGVSGLFGAISFLFNFKSIFN